MLCEGDTCWSGLPIDLVTYLLIYVSSFTQFVLTPINLDYNDDDVGVCHDDRPDHHGPDIQPHV